jgi:hypothetical protein
MFRLSAVDAVSPAFERMRAMLFRPFRFKTWLKIGFIGWLAGAGSGGFNFNVPSSWGRGGGGGGTAGQDVEQTIRAFFSEHLLLIVLIVAVAILIGLGLLYLACRFRFILFDSVLQKDPQIGRGWQRYGRQAYRYLGFMLGFMVASALVLALVVGLPVWHAYKKGVFQSNSPLPGILSILVPVLLGVFLFVVVTAIISSLANDFTVPMLALDDMTLSGAWSMLKEMISAEPWAFAGYLGMKLVLSIAAGIALAIAAVVTVLLLLIPGLIIAIVGVAIVKAAGGFGSALGILLAVLGGLAVFALILLLSMLAAAPVVVFFTSYAFYFFGGRYPRLGTLLWPQPPAPVTPPPLVPPPPLPGAAPAV